MGRVFLRLVKEVSQSGGRTCCAVRNMWGVAAVSGGATLHFSANCFTTIGPRGVKSEIEGSLSYAHTDVQNYLSLIHI